MKKLYKLTNGIGDYYVIAETATEAEENLKKVLDDGHGYGFSVDRQVHTITKIAFEIEREETVLRPYIITKRFLLL